jgi:hypothetical protein
LNNRGLKICAFFKKKVGKTFKEENNGEGPYLCVERSESLLKQFFNKDVGAVDKIIGDKRLKEIAICGRDGVEKVDQDAFLDLCMELILGLTLKRRFEYLCVCISIFHIYGIYIILK